MNNKEYADIVLKELTHTLTAIDQEAAKAICFFDRSR